MVVSDYNNDGRRKRRKLRVFDEVDGATFKWVEVMSKKNSILDQL